MPLGPFIDAIVPTISDEENWVVPTLDRYVQQAILQRYSQDNPLVLVSDVAGNGTAYLDVPEAPEGQFGLFDPLFSTIQQIEYPIEQVPFETLRQEDYSLYRAPSGYKLQLLSVVPQAGQVCRVTWTAQHNADGSTVAAADFYAVCDFAASLALEAMAARAIQFGDSTFGADTVNYRSKSQEFATLAKLKRKSYFNHFGIDENDHSVEDKPAIAQGSMHNILSSAGVDRLVHGRYTR